MKSSIKLPANYSNISVDEQKFINGGRPYRGGWPFYRLISHILGGFNITFGKGASGEKVDINYNDGNGGNDGYTERRIWESVGISGNINLGTLFMDLFWW